MPIDLITVSKSTVALKNFVEGDALSKALSEVGTSELDAAIDIANNIRYEKNKINAYNRLLGHLESAYHILCKSMRLVQSVVRPDKERKINYQIRYVCALAALCHKYLGNSNQIIEDWLIKKPEASIDQSTEWMDIIEDKCGENLGGFINAFAALTSVSLMIVNPLTYTSDKFSDVLTDEFISNVINLNNSNFSDDFDNM